VTVSLEQLPGVWRRELLAWPDGRRDTTTTVLWVQGPTFYADLRQGTDGQEGFAGELVLAGGVFEWCRWLDLSPPGPYGDRGRLAFDGDVLVEDGADVSYVERWRRLPRSTGISAALHLTRPGEEAVLVRAGAYLAYVLGVPGAQDCEIHICVDQTIEWSSVPGCLGGRFDPVLDGDRMTLGTEHWQVQAAEGDLTAFGQAGTTRTTHEKRTFP